jgi:hypothetical protein
VGERKMSIDFAFSSLDEILPGLERYGALKKEFEEYHEKLEREQVSFMEFLLYSIFFDFHPPPGSTENSLRVF